MSVTDQDARALAYLARRIRTEANAPTWDEAGTEAAIAKLIGRDLHPAAERVIRHAADPEARTPAAIHRPFLPEPPGPKPPSPPKPHEACTTCGKHRDRCQHVQRIDRTPPTTTYQAARQALRGNETP